MIKKELVGLVKRPDNPGSYSETQTIAKLYIFLLYINRYYIKPNVMLVQNQKRINVTLFMTFDLNQ